MSLVWYHDQAFKAYDELRELCGEDDLGRVLFYEDNEEGSTFSDLVC